MPKTTMPDQEILEAALLGFQHSLAEVEVQISDLRRRLGLRGGNHNAVAASAIPRKRKMSPAARRRIAEAQKRRWAEFRKAHRK